MARLSTNDERRFRDIAQNHQDLLEILFRNWVAQTDSGEWTPDERTVEHETVAKLRDTQGLISAIRVDGDAERERREAQKVTP